VLLIFADWIWITALFGECCIGAPYIWLTTAAIRRKKEYALQILTVAPKSPHPILKDGILS